MLTRILFTLVLIVVSMQIYALECELNIEECNALSRSGDTETQYKLGKYLVKDKNTLKEGFKWIEKAAKAGDPTAQRDIGVFYYLGSVVTTDYKKAFYWYQKSAEQGFSSGEYNLAQMYFFGQGVDKNITEAIKWYQKAAEQNHAYAQYTLGYIFHTGQGAPVNLPKSFKWYRKSAKNNNLKAQFNLGVLYYFGQGIAQNYTEAHFWFSKASNAGHQKALAFKEEVETKLTTKQIADARIKRAFNNIPKVKNGTQNIPFKNTSKFKNIICFKFSRCKELAKKRNNTAQFTLGVMYLYGEGTNTNKIKAHFWFSVADLNGYIGASKSVKDIEASLSPKQLTKAKEDVTNLAGQYVKN